ncbi:MAG: DUF4437 domain-containing protein, partial [Pirellulaceae bacterium]|nr:DUF4437 domain-containing protein [Pirellulaceae bacterium]
PLDGRSNGTFVAFPAGFSGEIRSHGAAVRAVVIEGRLQYLGTETKTLDPGSYFGSRGSYVHRIASVAGEKCILYVRSDGQYELAN